ncbi:MAG: hypothetical protein SGPRY_011404, partial [Prymnesium sp.]
VHDAASASAEAVLAGEIGASQVGLTQEEHVPEAAAASAEAVVAGGSDADQEEGLRQEQIHESAKAPPEAVLTGSREIDAVQEVHAPEAPAVPPESVVPQERGNSGFNACSY